MERIKNEKTINVLNQKIDLYGVTLTTGVNIAQFNEDWADALSYYIESILQLIPEDTKILKLTDLISVTGCSNEENGDAYWAFTFAINSKITRTERKELRNAFSSILHLFENDDTLDEAQLISLENYFIIISPYSI